MNRAVLKERILALLARAEEQAARDGQQAAAEGTPPVEEIITILRNPLARGANTIAALASVAILVLMVWRPGG